MPFSGPPTPMSLRNIKMAPYRNLSLEQIERKKYPPPKIDHYYVKKNQKNLRRTALCNSIYYLAHTFFIFKTRIWAKKGSWLINKRKLKKLDFMLRFVFLTPSHQISRKWRGWHLFRYYQNTNIRVKSILFSVNKQE